MFLKDTPIKQKLMAISLLTSAVVLFLTCAAFFAYEYITFRESTLRNVSTLGQMIAENINSSLTFDNESDARTILNALHAEGHIVNACIYDKNGKIFSKYPSTTSDEDFPKTPQADGYRFENGFLIGYEPSTFHGARKGTLYLKSDLGAMYERFERYSIIVLGVIVGAFLVAYALSSLLQKRISQPVLALAETVRAVSQRGDYSVRAVRGEQDELGLLTDAFNNMLEQILQRDIALQDAQQKLKTYAEDLEKRVAERTARLTETIVELEAFSYSVSHDMRAPLRAMQGYSDYLIETCAERLGPEGVQYLERIARAGRRLDRLVQDILTYSKISRGQLDLHPVDLDKLVDDIVLQYPGLQPPQTTITIQKPLGGLIGHEASLTQVISNLLSNAVKFVQPGQKPAITVRTEQNGVDLRLWVEDNGIGIAKGDRERIFGIFERIHPEKAYEGTGIGLSIVRKALERMGGRAGVESEPGQGSRFWIQLKKA